jgi:hypothetical protein
LDYTLEVTHTQIPNLPLPRVPHSHLAMTRLPRVALPSFPHHVKQRGNRRERTFFEDGDYALYLDLLAGVAARYGVEAWSYCLIPNHASPGRGRIFGLHVSG